MRNDETEFRCSKGISVKSVHAARILCFVFSAAFGLAAFRAVADSPLPQAPLELTAANLASVIDPLMAEWTGKRKGPGAVVVVVKRDAEVFAKGYGFSDVDARKPFTADATLMRPGSISKLFTGIAVMQLVDAGRLDLDRDVNGYIDFAVPTPEGGVPVTLRRLLTHRAGFEEHSKELWTPKPEPLGPWLARNLPQRLFPKGDVEAYSNYGVALAGHIVERISGEPFASYVQRHILDPLGMSHSTFRQPLPDDLAPLIAKGYRSTSDQPPLAFFEIIPAPAGGLSATGTDMGRFIRALMNGGELDAVRILPKARLDEMMAPSNATPAGYLGLVFFGTKAAGHDSIGHSGATMTFFSDLKIFTEQGVGIFVSRDGIAEREAAKDTEEMPDPATVLAERFLPDPATVIAERFLPRALQAGDARSAAFPSDAGLAGIYHSSRRAESSFMRFSDLMSQRVLKVDGAGNLRSFLAIWPFGGGRMLKRVERNLYELPEGTRIAFVDGVGSGSYWAVPALRMQRVPWFLDVRWIAPAFIVSTAVVLLTLLAWPVAALWRLWRKKRWSQNSEDRRKYLAVRVVLLIDAVVVVAAAVFFIFAGSDPRILNEALDPLLLVLYALAWLGVLGAIPTLWTATLFWRNDGGSRWSRVHHSLIAASSMMIAWFFLTFHIAGTTLTY
jgi:CubicO group peptidase (beta-lactamase class C family)